MDIQLNKKRGIQKKHLPYIIFGCLFAGLIFIAVKSGTSKRMTVDRNNLMIATVQENEFVEFIRINGQVTPGTTIQLSPLESGLIKEFVVEEGATVKKGDIIVRLENSGLSLDILNTEASLAEKENFLRDTRVKMEQEKLNLQQEMAQLLIAERRSKRKYEQYTRLIKDKLVSQEDYKQAEEDFELAQKRRTLVANRQIQDSIYRNLQIDNMENSLANMKKNMSLTYQRMDNLNVKSPIDGQVGSLDIVLGQNVSSGMKIGQVNDLSHFKIQALVDEHYIDRVSKGMVGSFERGNECFTLEVSKVYPEVSQRSFKIDLRFTGTLPDNIRTGQTHYIQLQTGTPDKCLQIPLGLFFQNTNGSRIFILSEDGKRATLRSIKIGRQNPNSYEITEGLRKGEQVIVSSYDAFGNNTELIIK